MNKKEALYAGVGGGLLFGITQSLTVGMIQGVSTGVFFGVALGVMMYLFAESKTVKNQIRLPESILLPDERLLLSKPANLVIKPKDFGLDDFACGGLFWVVGMKKKESLGGALHVTNYRVLFKSHRYNRLRGMTSIFLPTIQQLENRTVLVFRKLALSTTSAQAEFVVGEVDQVIGQIQAARGQLDSRAVTELQHHVRNFPSKCSDQLQPWSALNKLNSLFNFGKKATDVTRVITNPLASLSSLFINELLDKTVCDKWQAVFQSSRPQEPVQPTTESNKRPAA